MNSTLSSVAAAVGNFFGQSAGTSSGTVNATDLVKSAIIPAALYGLTLFLPFVHVPAVAMVGMFALDILRRLPHDAVPGVDAPGATSAVTSSAPAVAGAPATIPISSGPAS